MNAVDKQKEKVRSNEYCYVHSTVLFLNWKIVIILQVVVVDPISLHHSFTGSLLHFPLDIWKLQYIFFAGTDFHLVEGVYLCAQSSSGYKHGFCFVNV